MGYRSNGTMYLAPSVQELLTDELRNHLYTEWARHSTVYNVWEFEEWKWYSYYPEIKMWEKFFSMLNDNEEIEEEDYDIVIVGEDGAIYEGMYGYTGTKFEIQTIINIKGK